MGRDRRPRSTSSSSLARPLASPWRRSHGGPCRAIVRAKDRVLEHGEHVPVEYLRKLPKPPGWIHTGAISTSLIIEALEKLEALVAGESAPADAAKWAR